MSPSPLTQSLITGVRSDIKEVIKILAMYCCMAHSLISSNFQTNGTVKFLKKKSQFTDWVSEKSNPSFSEPCRFQDIVNI